MILSQLQALLLIPTHCSLQLLISGCTMEQYFQRKNQWWLASAPTHLELHGSRGAD